ncbi:hypothetical protein H4R33_003089 [Dimargaris cristalligena]|nr:hypothetical protein H4R33_003089 [Dimargaris cristalligena]
MSPPKLSMAVPLSIRGALSQRAFAGSLRQPWSPSRTFLTTIARLSSRYTSPLISGNPTAHGPRNTFGQRSVSSRSRLPTPAEEDIPAHSTAVVDPCPTPVAPAVQVPQDPHGIIQPESPATAVLANSSLIMTRQLEMINLLVGFEQANKYAIVDPAGQPVGFVAEQENFSSTISRQLLRTHRPFKATILDPAGQVVLEVYRPFALINSRIYIRKPDNGEVIGEVHQEWHLWKRRYDLFVRGEQFARIDGGFLTWDFNMVDGRGDRVSSINRNFSGFAREIFTDTGSYVLRLDDADGSARALTYDERAVALACAITIDVDYFSRHSGHGSGGIMPFPLFFPGGFGGGGGEAGEAAPGGVEGGSSGTDASVPPSTGGMSGEQPPHSYHQADSSDSPFLEDDIEADDDGIDFGDWD